MNAFDADAIIYAAMPGHPLGPRVRRVFDDADPSAAAGTGSQILLPETLSKPARLADVDALESISDLLARLTLLPLDERIADAAVELGARYRLRPADAVHLATAVLAGADRFITNNRRDFPKTITELDVVYPADLPA